jgi:flagellar biosynthesis/type III secretory pathway M-ring protein FliF/YscJ
MLAIAAFFRWFTGGLSRAWRTIAASKPLTYLLVGTLALLAAVFGVKRALRKARKAGADEREEKIFDRIERDTKDAIEKIETAERELSKEIGQAPDFEDTGDGRGLTTDDLNSRELERLRQRAAADPRNRGNPRTDPRGS